MSALWTWLIGTQTGRALLASLALCLAVYATYRVVDHRAFERGKADVQAQWDQAKAQARQQAATHNAGQSKAGADLAATTAQAASKAQDAVDKTNTETHEVIRHVYQDRPIPVPADPRCVLLPVDDRVQRRIELGVDQARAAAR